MQRNVHTPTRGLLSASQFLPGIVGLMYFNFLKEAGSLAFYMNISNKNRSSSFKTNIAQTKYVCKPGFGHDLSVCYP